MSAAGGVHFADYRQQFPSGFVESGGGVAQDTSFQFLKEIRQRHFQGITKPPQPLYRELLLVALDAGQIARVGVRPERHVLESFVAA
ncbi:hypothetical protein MA04_03481 [Alcanivorax balearicus MACL04]|uniref:Uncharacterized protein n=1 Tax=Alloalcanivorax balearicus MACL04 TaxID=1177182 RepID=A0ABT2R333_9GAMM|nr:hypothetical protein [Alloalcanivorax balearicus MACL04]